MCRPPMMRQPGPRYKPGALSKKAMIELVSPFQERRAISSSAIPAGFPLNRLEIALRILFIVEWLLVGPFSMVAYEALLLRNCGRIPQFDGTNERSGEE